MKIEKSVIEKYMIQCPLSTSKCESYRDIEDKIRRAIHIGRVSKEMNGKKYINYYHNCFVVKGNKVVDLYKDRENYWHVYEEAKNEYDGKFLKIIV